MDALTAALLLESEDCVWLRQDPSLPTQARRAASSLAERIGMGAQRTAEVELAVTEVATNLIRHARDGAMVLRVLSTADSAAVELLAIDSGPGMSDLAVHLADGFSSAGTLGIGLGIVARMADSFDIHSAYGRGTVLAARFWPVRAPAGAAPARGEPVTAGVTRPLSGEAVCGDAWAARLDRGDGQDGDARDSAGSASPALLVMLCDGLGHGPLAALAAQQAVSTFRASRHRQPAAMLAELHGALSGTRGAALAVARIEPDTASVLFCGVGNISAFLVGEHNRTALLSAPGIVGHQMPKTRTFEQPLPARGALVMHSDGLTERWEPASLPGLLEHCPAVVAGQLLREAGARRDDASVVVAKGHW